MLVRPRRKAGREVLWILAAGLTCPYRVCGPWLLGVLLIDGPVKFAQEESSPRRKE